MQQLTVILCPAFGVRNLVSKPTAQDISYCVLCSLELTASLRGRPLMGIQLQIPTGYAGSIIYLNFPINLVAETGLCIIL